MLCPNGQCVIDASSCIEQPACKNQQVRCFDGSCQSSYQACINTVVIVNNNQAAESICGAGNVMCSDGSCAPSLYYCPPIPRCPPATTRCQDGSCQLSCAGISKSCTASGQKLCEDGICRSSCLRYMGCGLDKPYHCRNRECHTSADENACENIQTQSVQQGYSSSGRRLLADDVPQLFTYNVSIQQNLPLTQPSQWSQLVALENAWLYAGEKYIYTAHVCGYGTSANTCECKDGSCYDIKTPGAPCVAQTDTCNADAVAPLLQFTISYRSTSVFSIASLKSLSVAQLTVPAGAVGVASAQMTVRSVASSQLQNIANIIDLSRASYGYETYFTLASTLLSVAFECVVDSSVTQPFLIPLSFTASVDLTRYPSFRDICLAYVNTTLTSKGPMRRWMCVNPVRDDANAPLPKISLSGQVPVGTATATISNCKAGVFYGFVHNPRFNSLAIPPDTSSWIVGNVVYLILGLSAAVALLLLGAYFCVRLARYRKKYHGTRLAADIERENVQEKELYGGKAGRQDQEIMLTENPLVAQIEDLQANDPDALHKIERELAERQQDAKFRETAMKELSKDKDELAAQLAMLKAQLEATKQPDTQEPARTAGGRLDLLMY